VKKEEGALLDLIWASSNSPDSAVFFLLSGKRQVFLLPQVGIPSLGNTQNCSVIQTARNIIKDQSIVKFV